MGPGTWEPDLDYRWDPGPRIIISINLEQLWIYYFPSEKSTGQFSEF